MLCIAWIMAVGLAGCGGGASSGSGGKGGTGGEAGTGGGGEGGAGATGGQGGGGAGGAGGQGGAGGGGQCGTQASSSAANHIVITVSWPDTLGLKGGEGDMHVWTKADLNFNGNDVTGKVRPCGSVIPPLTKSDVAGGGQVQTQIPDAVWDAPSMPTFDVKGSISGFEVGATITMDPVASTVGCTLKDPANDAWPASGAMLMTVDSDGDGQPGIKAIPRTDPPFAAPPLSLADALDMNGKRADELYLATRTMIQLAGTRDTCKSAKGMATVTHVDSHVVGCHVKGGGPCDATQTKFVDDNQPKFTIKSAKYEMVQVDAKATCADVRAALPMQ
jgi:hypothetical protein